MILKRTIHRWVAKLVFCLLLTGLPVLAQNGLQEFEEALERWEFQRAESLLVSIKDPQARLLAESELQFEYDRPDRTFVLTDKLNLSTLDPSLQAKYHYVKVRQEAARADKTLGELKTIVLRLTREGLRRNPRPYDRRRLIFYRLGWSDKSQQGFGREAILEMGEMGSEWGLQAEARVAQRQGDAKRAATLYRNLLELAELKGHRALAVRHATSLRRNLRNSGRKKEADALLPVLTKMALSSGEPYVIMKAALANLAALKKRDEQRASALFQKFSPHLREPDLKVRLMERYASKLAREKKLVILKEAEELALSAGDINLQIAMVYEQLLASSDGAFRLLRKRMGKLVEGRDVRGTRYAWFSFPSRRTASSDSGDPVSQFRGKVSAASNKRQRVEARREAYYKAFSSLDLQPELAREVLANFAEDLPKLSDLDVVIELQGPWEALSIWSFGGQILGRGENAFRPTDVHLGQALGFIFQSEHPRALRRALSSHVSQINEKLQNRYRADRLIKLANFLCWLGRSEEAIELDRAALRLEPQLKKYRARRDHLVLAGRFSQATELQEKILSDSLHPWRDWTIRASLELAAGDHLAALSSCQQAMKARPKDVSPGELAYSGLPYYMVEALLKASQFQQAEDYVLKLLQEQERPSQELLVLRAQAVLASGRPEIAHRIFSRAGDGHDSYARFYRSLRQTEFSQALKDEARTQELAAAAKTQFQALASKTKDPALAHFYLRAPAFASLPFEVVPPPLPLTKASTSSFAEILEQIEELRRREPDNEELGRLSAKDLKLLMTEAKPKELFVQPILLEHSIVTICLAQNQGIVKETFCDVEHLRQAMLRVSVAAAQLRRPKSLSEEQAYVARWLVRPWREQFPQHSKIRWMGEGKLHDFPVSLLQDEKGPLLDQVSFLYLDGPMSRVIPVDRERQVLLVGGADDLPGTEAELREIRKLFPAGESWRLGQKLDLLKSLAEKHSLVHISTHGAAPDEKRLAGELKGTSGSLTAFHLSELRFPPQTMAVLGACDSGLGHGQGHDNTSLISALRTAGADMVLGSTWTLDDGNAGRLFLEFYREILQGTEAPLALARAQNKMKKTHPHPYYWAGVRLVTGP